MNLYFDNAATSRPKPACVGDAMARALIACGNPGRGGHAYAMNAARVMWEAREAAASMFGLSNPENVIFTLNCTQSINMVLAGALYPGDHVVVSDVEHNAVMRPLTEWRIPYTAVRTVAGDTAATVAAFEAAIRPTTRLIFCTHASNVTGEILPIAALGELAQRRGLALAVDGAQSGGILPLHMERDHVDFLCLPGHKGLYGPSGTGLLLSSQKLPLAPLFVGGTGSHSLQMTQPESWPERMESGTPNVVGVAGLGAALRWLSPRRESVAAHEFAQGKRLWERLSAVRGVRVHTACPSPKTTVPLVLFSVDGESSEQTAERLGQCGVAVRAGLHCAPTGHRKLGTLPDGGVRVAPGAFTAAEDVDRLVALVACRRSV